MKCIRLILSALFLNIAAAMSADRIPGIVNDVLDSLDYALSIQPSLISERKAEIDSLKGALPGGEPREAILCRIAELYKGLNNDSSIHYFFAALNEADAANNLSCRRYVLPELGERLVKATRFQQGITTVDTLDISDWSPIEKIHYYGSLSHMFIDGASYQNLSFRHAFYREKAAEALESLLTLLNDKNARSLVLAQIYLLNDKQTLAFAELNEAFNGMDKFSPDYAVIANMLAYYYKDKPEYSQEYTYYLALSALADANRANGETFSLILLGKQLMEKGHMDHAYRYLSAADSLINESNSNLYKAELVEPLMDFATLCSENRKSASPLLIILSALLLFLSVWLFIAWRKKSHELKKSEQSAGRMASALTARDVYINRLIALCGVYVEGLEEFNRLVIRKLKANQVQDLYKQLEDGKILRDQSDNFFEVFDEAILKIYPDFLNEINSLLAEDKRFDLQPGERLNPELRILAFMRLGVTDSNMLAKFLGLSLNTIYTYRNRLKSRAIDRDNFEENLSLLNNI